MSFTIHGTGVSGGICIGHAHIISSVDVEVDHYQIPQEFIKQEIARFETAIKVVHQELDALEALINEDSPAEMAAFISLHRMMLDDEAISHVPIKLIREQSCNAEWAIRQQLDHMLEQFDEIQDEYLRERKSDVQQVVERVLNALSGQATSVPEKLQTRAQDTILVALDLSPADVILFKNHHVAAFITDMGGVTSHTAILARSLNVPSIVALHHARELIREDELIIVDGTQGVVIINPDATVLDEYQLKQNQWNIERKKLARIRTAVTETLDSVPVELYANIELPDDLDSVRKSGAMGVGLFRTEFLFLNRQDRPDEEEQFAAYKAVAEGMKGMPVTIRTLDIGADKNPETGGVELSDNPALGLRGIRYCLAEPEIFNTQLRALLRASRYGNIQILIPMLSSLSELNQTLAAVESAKQQLQVEGKKFNAAIKVGGMIEVPAAAISLPMFLKKLDFISIGTNDLIQYTLAIDRADDSVAHLYDPLHPAVLFLVAHVIKQANTAGVPVTVCGEMAGDVALTRMLLGFGLRQFSMHPANVLTVKQRILISNMENLEPLANRMLKLDNPEKMLAQLEKLNT